MKKLFLCMLSLFALVFVKVSAQELHNREKDIRINFDFTRKLGLASNQFAVWVENEQGVLVKNIFVTKFTAGRGWEKRPESLPSWRKAVKDAQTDSVSGATPKSGPVRFEWDMKDETGQVVEKGVYKICIEATIKWEHRVLFVCEIKIDEKTVAIGEVTEKMSGAGDNEQNLITNVEIR